MTNTDSFTFDRPEEISHLDAEIMRAAINIAKRLQIRGVARLKDQLYLMYPGQNADVDRALVKLANLL